MPFRAFEAKHALGSPWLSLLFAVRSAISAVSAIISPSFFAMGVKNSITAPRLRSRVVYAELGGASSPQP
jgi:hypothetical protein